MNRRLLRIHQEVLALAKHYGEVEFDEVGGTWVMAKEFPLPRRWPRESTAVLLKLPPTYPETPPYGFFLDRGLGIQGPYHEHAVDAGAEGWAWFCLHVEIGWRATADIWSGDTLMTVAASISAALTNLGRQGG